MSKSRSTVEKIIAGNIGAFEQVFRLYSRELYFIAYGLSNDSEVARDVVQETFLYLWEYRRGINPEYPIQNYLRTIVRNKVHNQFRQREVHRRHNDGIMRQTREDAEPKGTDMDWFIPYFRMPVAKGIFTAST